MAKISAKYETIFIVDLTIGEEKIKELVEKFKALIEKNGKVESVEDWGVKKLAYEINYIREGHYVLVNFEAGADFVAELNRVYNITDGVMRSIVVNKDEK